MSIMLLSRVLLHGYTGKKELGNMTNSMKKEFMIVLVVVHHFTSLLPSLTPAVVGLHFLRVCLEL